MSLNSGHENINEGVKKSKKINLGTKHKSLKACTTGKKKSNLVDEQSVHLNQRFIGSKVIKCTNVDKIPLKEEDHNSWLEFKKLNEGRPVLTCIGHKELDGKWHKELEGKWPINVDHPFVAVIRDFATDAFNAVAHMRSKSSSLCNPEVMSCRYINVHRFCYFFMTMEGIEEGILGVYKIIVACDLIDGSTSLLRLKLTNLTPTGKIAMMLPHLISLRSKHTTMKGMERDLKAKLKKTRKSIKDKKENIVAAELIQLEEEHKAIKEKCSILYQQIQSQIPETWFPPGVHQAACWSGASHFTTGLMKRSDSPGYDYYTRSHDFKYYEVIR